MAAIGALIRQMGSFTTRLVRRAGKWVTELVRVPGEPMSSAPVVPLVGAHDDYDGVKKVAGLIAAGVDPSLEDLANVSDKTLAWLGALERDALLKVALAHPSEIRAHMKNQQRIVGLVPFNQAAIDDVSAAKDKPRPSQRKRTLRDELEEQLGVSLAA